MLPTHAEESEISLHQLDFYIESNNQSGFITPDSSLNGSVNVESYAYMSDQLWEVLFLSDVEYIRDNDYCAIRSKEYLNQYICLKYDEVQQTLELKLEYNSNYYLLSDEYFWKIEEVGSGAYYDIYLLTNKAYSGCYLTTVDGELTFTTSLGTGREQAIHHWIFHNIERPIINLTNTENGKPEDYNIRQISLLNTYNEVSEFDLRQYFGAYISGTENEVIESCQEIGTSKICEYDEFNRRGLMEIISQSSLCVISAHGTEVDNETKTELCCTHLGINDNGKYYGIDNYLNVDYINDLPNNYFSGTKCIVLLVCKSAKYSPDSLADAFHRKGAQTVVAFTEKIWFRYDENSGIISPNIGYHLYAQKFLHELSLGKTVQNAADDAYEYFEDTFTFNEDEEENGKIFLEYDEKEHEHGFFGLRSLVIKGNANIVLKN